VLGRRGSDVFPDDYETWLPILADVVDGQRSVRLERGSPALGRIWSTRFFPYGGDRYASIYHDITARKQAEAALQASAARQAYLLRLADALRPLRDAEAIRYEAACVLGEHLAAARVYYSDIDQERGTIDIARNWTRHGAGSIAGRYPFAMFSWIGPAFAAGTAVTADDARTSPLIPDVSRPALADIGVGAFIAAPLVKDGRLVAALSVIEREARAWTPGEIELVEETAERTWASVERARAEAALKDANDALEERVRERTAQLEATNDALEREVRERRLDERQIKSLFRRLVSTQEEERRRIARDIHDQLGQQMTALRMRLDALHARTATSADLREAVERSQELAVELDQCIDFLTWELRPSALDHLGLAASLRGLVRSWAERFGIEAEFECSAPEDIRLPPEVEANVYRLVQEALHNIVKHAAARHVSVLLSHRAGQAILVIEDDGRGFHVDEPAANRGLGLISMRERATLVGGEIEIDSAPGRGTSIFVKVPIENV
jgi:signal transduction histidine kinase